MKLGLWLIKRRYGEEMLTPGTVWVAKPLQRITQETLHQQPHT